MIVTPFGVTLNGVTGETKGLPGEENPFVFGDVVTRDAVVDRVNELAQVIRDVTDRQKLFLLSPRRFGKSSLVGVAFERLKAEGFSTVIIPVSDDATYRQLREHGLGPASTVQEALQSLDAQDIIDRYEDRYFFLDPLFAFWVRERMA